MSFLGDLNRTFDLFKWILGGRLNDSSNSWAMPAFSHPLAMWRLPISLLRWLYRSTNHEAWTLIATQYKEPGQDGKFDDCTKDVLEELCEDDYSDAEEEFEPNVDTD